MLVVDVTPSSVRITWHSIAGEFNNIECNAICPLGGGEADPELRGNILIGVIGNTAQDEHEPAKYVQTSMNIVGVLDQREKVLS